MKAAAYMALHYGADYMGEAIRAVIDQVDSFYILYTRKPSYGHDSGLICPDSYELLYEIAQREAGEKLRWVTIKPTSREGDHRNQIFQRVWHMDKPDILAVVDADEVWEPEAFGEALHYAGRSSAFNIGARHDGWFHFWRSFDEVCTDGFNPIRFHNLRNGRNTQDINCPCRIYHFGYAQRDDIMSYKWSIHGHKDELRKNWFREIYNGYRKGVTRYLHPASMQIWEQTQGFDKTTLPDFMRAHPFYNLNPIK